MADTLEVLTLRGLSATHGRAEGLGGSVGGRHGVRGGGRRRRASGSPAGGRELLFGVARTCEVVFAGSGDWGPCTSWSLPGAVGVGGGGPPAGLIGTTAFQG